MNWLYRYRLAIILAIIKFVLPFTLQHSLYELHRDEMLYLEQGHHLAWGFKEVPPLLSLFAKLTQLLGNGFFWVKCWPSLFGAATVFVACMIAMEMGGKMFAQLLAGLSIIAGAYMRVHFLFQPNFLEIFFWTLCAYFIVRYINTRNRNYWYHIAVVLALSFLSKYSAIFFMAGIFVALLFTNRKLFTTKHIYLAFILMIIIILPNLLWQYYHNWPVVKHMKELRETQLQYVSPVDFLKNQVLMNLPSAFLWLGALFWLFYQRKYMTLAIIYITVVVILAASNGKEYYTLGTYPMLFAAGGVWFEKITAQRYWFRFVSVFVIIALLIPVVPVLLPVWTPEKLAVYYKKSGLDKTGILRWEDRQEHPLPQDFADMLCWKEIGNKVSSIYHSLPTANKNRTLIYCTNYGLAGAASYYGKDLPQVTSTNGSFMLWMPDRYNINTLLYVGEEAPGKDEKIFQHFAKQTVVDSITTEYARERGGKIILFEQADNEVNGLIEDAINKMKDRFRRR